MHFPLIHADSAYFHRFRLFPQVPLISQVQLISSGPAYSLSLLRLLRHSRPVLYEYSPMISATFRRLIGQQANIASVKQYILDNELYEYSKQTLVLEIISQVRNIKHNELDEQTKRISWQGWDYYIRLILKNYISIIETQHVDVIDEIYEWYTDMMSKPFPNDASTKPRVVEYYINDSIYLTILENPNIISSQGSTGQRTWESSLVLADYILTRGLPGDYRGYNVIELGAGTGFLGILMSKLQNTREQPEPSPRVILTDGEDSVVKALDTNIKLNLLNPNKILATNLYWGKDPPINTGRDQIVVAADVIYDLFIIPSLVDCLKKFLSFSSTRYIVISNIIRSEETYKTFEDQCKLNEISLEILHSYFDTDNTQYFYLNPLLCEIRICLLKSPSSTS